jgi:putative hydrolase of the HAD superfamily
VRTPVFVDSLVIFDLDNTLADREMFFGEWAESFVRSRKLNPEIALPILRLADEDGVASRSAFFAQAGPTLGIDEPVADLVAEYWRDQIARYRCDADTTAGLRTLRCLGYKIGIATNGGATQIDKIKACGLDSLVDGFCVSRMVGHSKPDPGLFAALAEECGASLNHAWVVGDRPDTDIAGAVAIGAPSVWIHRGMFWPIAEYGPTVVADNAADAIRLIISIDTATPRAQS